MISNQVLQNTLEGLKEISRTAQAGFNSSDFNEMFFPLPPYEEQKRIVNAINKTFTILDTIMENL